MAGLNLQSYQEQILRLLEGGFRFGQLPAISVGRQTGKSHYYSYMKGLQNRIHDTNLCKEIFMPTKPKTKYKFSRAKWYRAEMNITSPLWHLSNDYNKVIEWCTEQFGAHPKTPDAWSRWHVSIGYINFRDEKDYMLYQLKWA